MSSMAAFEIKGKSKSTFMLRVVHIISDRTTIHNSIYFWKDYFRKSYISSII